VVLLPAKIPSTVFGDNFVVTTRGWEAVMTSRPQGSEVGIQCIEHRAAPQVYKVMFMSILW
jgi:hypothetical protein